jgi:hypothetical protein
MTAKAIAAKLKAEAIKARAEKLATGIRARIAADQAGTNATRHYIHHDP